MEGLGSINGLPYSQTGDRDQDEKLLQPFKYILQVPGKQIRTKLAVAFNYWLNIPSDKLVLVGDVVQMLHNSSLLSVNFESLEKSSVTEYSQHESCKFGNYHLQEPKYGSYAKSYVQTTPTIENNGKYINFRIDDIQDNSILRRGIPVAHSIYGVASTILAANYVLFLSLERILHLGNPEAIVVYNEQLLELFRGQGMEIYWRDNYICPSEEEYKEMTKKKTGGLFMLALRLMQLFSENKADFTKLTGILGLYFQLRDDYCNLCLQEYSENKSYCEDLTEGKFSFPIIHAILNHPEDTQVTHIIRQRTQDIEIKKYCIKLLHSFGSFDYTKKTLEELDAEARAEIAKLGGNPLLLEVLDELLNWKKGETEREPLF